MKFDGKKNIFVPLLVYISKKDVIIGGLKHAGIELHDGLVLVVPDDISSGRKPLKTDNIIVLFFKLSDKINRIP